MATGRPDVRGLLEDRCEACESLERFKAALDAGATAAWVAVDGAGSPELEDVAKCARRHVGTRIGLVAPMTVPLAREALCAGFVDVLWWPASDEEFDRATWGLARPDARALLAWMGRVAKAWEDPESWAVRTLCDPAGEPHHSVRRLARASKVSPRELRRAWRETLRPWTPKVTLDWVLWLRGLALVEGDQSRRGRGLYRMARELGMDRSTLDRTALRCTGLRFLKSVEEPGRSRSLGRFECEWREVLAHG